MQQLGRDPFARTTTVKEKLPVPKECNWCGQLARYQYGAIADGINTKPHYVGPFCGINCYKTHLAR